MNDIAQLKLDQATQIIERWILQAPGRFTVRDLDNDLQSVKIQTGESIVGDSHVWGKVVTTEERTIALERLVERGVIEHVKTGSVAVRGQYQTVDNKMVPMNYMNPTGESLDLWLPFNLHNMVDIMSGNIILFSGTNNSGKSAICYNIIKYNQDKHRCVYFNSESADIELHKRLKNFEPDFNMSDWKFEAYERYNNFHQVIQPDAINIIDFMESHGDFFQIGGHLKQIHEALGKGIAIVMQQKNHNTDYGLGGERTMEVARLVVAVEFGKAKLTKVKAFTTVDENNNPKSPHGFKYEFSLRDGIKFSKKKGWS